MFTAALIVVGVAILVVGLLILLEQDTSWLLGSVLGGVFVLSYGATLVVDVLPATGLGFSKFEVAVYFAAVCLVLLVPLSIYFGIRSGRRNKRRK